MSKIFAISAAMSVTLLLGASAAYILMNKDFAQSRGGQCEIGQVGGASIGGPFRLRDGNGTLLSDADVIDKPSLVYFGYTFCPDVCPFDMSRNAEVADILAEKGHDLGVVFITLDPARDSEEVVEEYAKAFHDKAIGLTGTAEEVDAAARAYRVFYKAQPSEDDFYTVDHSTFTYLMLPQSGFADFYRRDVSAVEMAESVSCILGSAQ